MNVLNVNIMDWFMATDVTPVGEQLLSRLSTQLHSISREMAEPTEIIHL